MLSLNCPSDGCYGNYLCDIEKKGRVVAAALVLKTSASQVDKSSPEDFILSIRELALVGKANMLLNISGEKPRPDTSELAGRGLQEVKIGGSTHTINFTDMQGVANVEWYNKIRRTSQKYDLYFFTPELYWDASANQITLIGSPVITNDLKAYIGSEATIKWVSNGDPLPYELGSEVVEDFLEGLFYEISGLDELTTTVASGDTTNYTAQLSVDFGSFAVPNLIWSVEGSSSNISNTGATIDPVTGELELNPVTTGTFPIVIKVTNQYGCIFGTYNVTVIVED